MIVCQNCKSTEPDGTIFCSECGLQVGLNSTQTHKFDQENTPLAEEIIFPTPTPKRNGVWLSLHFLETGNVMEFSEQTEFTLGRISENQPIEPDIDLSTYNAIDHGVSRIHAVVKSSHGKIIVMDLGSSNGTYINGIRIMPNTEHALHQGDIFTLGKLKMKIG